MKTDPDFVIVGSGGGGGTIAWVLASAGYEVVLLEQGIDLGKTLRDTAVPFDPSVHDEEFFRLRRPDPKRRLRGDYNTFLDLGTVGAAAKPFDGGWTGSVLGGGTVLWGTWSFRPLPIDFKLKTFYEQVGELPALQGEGYSLADWPISYKEMLPYFDVAETLLGVSGDRDALCKSIATSSWYQEFKARFGNEEWFGAEELWFPKTPFPLGPYPITPVGRIVWDGMVNEDHDLGPFPTPVAIVRPGVEGFATGQALSNALAAHRGELNGGLWEGKGEKIWSDRVRQACNMCGHCGEFLCWGRTGPKWGTADTTLLELSQRKNVEIRCSAKALEVMHDPKTKRATGVAYLDLSDPDHPRRIEQNAKIVIVSCGAVQTARLLLLSRLGNSSDELGRNASFHLFGLGMRAVLGDEMQGLLHGEFGPTGNVSTFAPYFVQDAQSGRWIKGGHLTSAAKKNALEDATLAVTRGTGMIGIDLLNQLLINQRTLEVRLTGDDLPRGENRVRLDPDYVDEYGVPVARIERNSLTVNGVTFMGPNEQRLDAAIQPVMKSVFGRYAKRKGALAGDPKATTAIPTLVGDHQMGTCRMGDDPASSVVNRNCRLHDVENVFVVDSSFMPTGLGLNPMVTVVANALRVGSHIVTSLKQGRAPG